MAEEKVKIQAVRRQHGVEISIELIADFERVAEECWQGDKNTTESLGSIMAAMVEWAEDVPGYGSDKHARQATDSADRARKRQWAIASHYKAKSKG